MTLLGQDSLIQRLLTGQRPIPPDPLCFEGRYESVRESYHAHVVDCYFVLNLPDINGMGVC